VAAVVVVITILAAAAVQAVLAAVLMELKAKIPLLHLAQQTRAAAVVVRAVVRVLAVAVVLVQSLFVILTHS
jgi:hypothetical protein